MYIFNYSTDKKVIGYYPQLDLHDKYEVTNCNIYDENRFDQNGNVINSVITPILQNRRMSVKLTDFMDCVALMTNHNPLFRAEHLKLLKPFMPLHTQFVSTIVDYKGELITYLYAPLGRRRCYDHLNLKESIFSVEVKADSSSTRRFYRVSDVEKLEELGSTDWNLPVKLKFALLSVFPPKDQRMIFVHTALFHRKIVSDEFANCIKDNNLTGLDLVASKDNWFLHKNFESLGSYDLSEKNYPIHSDDYVTALIKEVGEEVGVDEVLSLRDSLLQ